MVGGGGEPPTGANGIPRNYTGRLSPGNSISKYPGPYNPYPPEYNARIHGPYDPQRYYGSRRLVCWWNVKLKDLPLEIFLADRNLAHLRPTVARWTNKMLAKWVRPKHGFPLFPFAAAMTIFYMFTHRQKTEWGNTSVHHW